MFNIESLGYSSQDINGNLIEYYYKFKLIYDRTKKKIINHSHFL